MVETAAGTVKPSIEAIDTARNFIDFQAFAPSRIVSPMNNGLGRMVISVADENEREVIYGARHDVDGRELGQHPANAARRLRDKLDDANVYLVARINGELAGFISVTPPGAGGYSIDKYFTRSEIPFEIDGGVYEVRLLTVLRPHRGRALATLLMYAAFRWIESHGGTRVVAIGREELLEFYTRSGLVHTGIKTQSGAVRFELLHAETQALQDRANESSNLLARLERNTEWRLHFPFRKPAACFHGGAFFRAIGERFEDLDRRRGIINADVLDAWFEPSQRVLSALSGHLPWLLQTSPPTACEGLIEVIAEARGVEPENVLAGGGSSDLIFRAFREWLRPASRALILDPTYGEYAHVLEKVIGCRVDRFALARERNYEIDLKRFEQALGRGYDLVVVVNPNSPTGRHVDRRALQAALSRVPPHTRIWVDETYVEYAGAGQSLERFAAGSENVVVCKSMSKVYALSGARVAYLCAAPHQLEQLRAVTPPWVVSLPAQVAAVSALRDPDYYARRYCETAGLRETLASDLAQLGWEVLPGIANFLLCHLPEDRSDAAALVAACRRHGLFLRDASLMGAGMGTHTIRVAVKDVRTNRRMIEIIRSVLGLPARSAMASRRLELVGSVTSGYAAGMEPAFEISQHGLQFNRDRDCSEFAVL